MPTHTTIDEYRRDPDKRFTRFVQVNSFPTKEPEPKVKIVTVYSSDSHGRTFIGKRETTIKEKTVVRWPIVSKEEVERVAGIKLP